MVMAPLLASPATEGGRSSADYHRDADGRAVTPPARAGDRQDPRMSLLAAVEWSGHRPRTRRSPAAAGGCCEGLACDFTIDRGEVHLGQSRKSSGIYSDLVAGLAERCASQPKIP